MNDRDDIEKEAQLWKKHDGHAERHGVDDWQGAKWMDGGPSAQLSVWWSLGCGTHTDTHNAE